MREDRKLGDLAAEHLSEALRPDDLLARTIVAADMRLALRGVSVLGGILALAFSVVAFFVYGLLDPVTWRLLIIGGSIAALSLVLVGWNIVLKRKPSLELMHEHLMLSVVLGSPIMAVTGGTGSPFLAFLAPMAFLGGLMAPTVLRGLLFGLVCLPLSLVLGGVGDLGWLPVAAESILSANTASSPAHFFVSFGMNAVVMFVLLGIGMSVQRILRRVVGDMLRARQRALLALTNRNLELESVASTVAHELKNPLAAIQGLVELMVRDTPAGSREAGRMEVILRETGRMASTLDEFRNFTRPLSALNLEKTSLDALLREVASLNEGFANVRRVELHCDEQEAVVVACDPHKVSQAVMNVVQNAIEATGPGGRVRLALDAIDVAGRRFARVVVADTGPGIAPDVLERLFQPGTTTKQKGSGMGLVIARAICQQHGGRLELANGPRGGCVATLTFPATAGTGESVEGEP